MIVYFYIVNRRCFIRSILISLPNPLNLFHVGWFAVAGDQQEDQRQQRPYHKCDMEYIIFVECVVEVHVVDLHTENHVDFGVAGVGWERADAQLDNAN